MVYGTDFALDGVPLDPQADYFVTDLSGFGVLTGTYENGNPIDLLFLSDVPIYLATPVQSVQEVMIDIKPGSCPNPVNVKNKGVLPIAILGAEEFDVLSLDPVSIRLEEIPAVRSSYEDVETPLPDNAEICECTTEGPDGYLVLTLKFNVQEIVEALGEVIDGEELELTLTGVLNDGTSIEGKDCVQIISKGKPK